MHRMSNNNNKSALMIKLAPSPRDRSFRSQTSNTISSPRGSNCSLSPRSGSDVISPRSNATTVNRHHRRNRSNGSNESPEIAKYTPFERIFNGQITALVRCATRHFLCIAILSNLPRVSNSSGPHTRANRHVVLGCSGHHSQPKFSLESRI